MSRSLKTLPKFQMKTKLKHLLRGLSILLCLFFASVPQALHAQQSPAQCVANIQKRLDALGNAPGFDYLEARDIIKNFPFGKIPDAVADPAKAAAFKRVFTSLSDFIDAAPNSISGKGMSGYTRTTGVLFDSVEDAVSRINVEDLKKAFTKQSGFQGSDFDLLMRKLDDTNRFSYDGNNRTISSDKGYKLGVENYQVNGDKGGEKTALTHILRGHLDNTSVTSNTSKFFNAADIPDVMDEAWEKIKRFRSNPASEPDVQLFNGQANAYVVTFKDQAGNPKNIGRNLNNTADTNRVRLFANGSNGPDFIRTIFPE
jgi:hypothetical protein